MAAENKGLKLEGGVGMGDVALGVKGTRIKAKNVRGLLKTYT